MSKVFQIAIDGPVGVGSSTTAKLVAERLGFLFVDTGAMYRCVALLGMRSGIVDFNQEEIVSLLEKSRIELETPKKKDSDGRLITVKLDGEDVSWRIRSRDVSSKVAIVAAMPKVRELLVIQQQRIAKEQSVVMEGRDITYKVLPNADLKIYLTATALERANRRYSQLLNRGERVDLIKVAEDLKARDEMDMNRSTDPLKIVEDAWVLDTTSLSLDEVVDEIVGKVSEIRSK